jgi:hypothetical protein
MESVIANLESLLKVLKRPAITRQLDARLADYVFFPISNVLQQLESLPLRGQEYTLEAISVLLQTAWRRDINPDLSIQLMILLTFLTDAKGGKEKNRTSSEEVRLWSFTCLGLVFQAQAHSNDASDALVALKNVPHVGKTLSVLLESIVRKDADKVIAAALDALEAFCIVWPDPDSLGMKFFPGIISTLTKVLNFKPSERRPYPILAAALKVYSLVLLRVLGDEQVQKFAQSETSRIDDAWVKGTADQVKISLSQTLKLRNHNNQDIRKAVGRLALQCVEKSWASLAGSRDLLIDSLVSVSVTDDSLQSQLRSLLLTRPDITNIVRSSLYQKVSALPRTMHSTDDSMRRGSLNQVSLTLKFLADQSVDLSLVENILATNLRDSVVNIMQAAPKSQMVVDTSAVQPTDLIAISRTSSTEFEDVLSVSTRQTHSSKELDQLLADISSQKCAINLAQELVASIDRTDSNQQVATLWVVLHLLRGIENQPKAIDDANGEALTDLIDEVYDFSLGTLSGTKDKPQDWRLQALALEAVALQSHRLKESFGPELVDCLYPIVQLLGSANPLLQRHAQSCLNYVAQQSGHQDVGDMIVKNVDYLVNAVSLRLSTFEISPQAPQVLIMMVRLAGGSLLPYLDDIVDNVFTALELFHGYPKLVDLLFSALEVIVEEGARSPRLLLESSASTNEDFHVRPTTVAELVEMFRAKRPKEGDLDSQEGADDDEPNIFEWKELQSAKNGPKDDSETEEEEHDEPNEAVEHSKDDDKLPTPHAILLNISKLTQHFLTTESLELRIRLLSLLKTSFPALARHEDSFLPLINTLWPVLVPRLHDPEAFVVSGALDAIALLCVHAKGFMTSRIKEIWPGIQSLYRRYANHSGAHSADSNPKNAQHPGRAMLTIRGGPREHMDVLRPSRGNAAIVWPSLARLLVAIANNVNVDDGRMDEILAMLAFAAKSQPDVLEALNRRNADAVWLMQHRLQRKNEGLAKPISRRGWRFAEAW